MRKGVRTMNTGEKIKMLRKSAKMTQAELAEKLGVRDAAVAKYETGRVTNLKRETIAKLAEIFDVSPIYFMDDDIVVMPNKTIDMLERNAKKMYADKKTIELNDIFEELSDTQRLKVLEYARLVKEGVL